MPPAPSGPDRPAPSGPDRPAQPGPDRPAQPGPDRPGVDDPGRGRRIGIDVGSVRIGVASCDPDCILATPVETVPRSKEKGPDAPDIRRIVELVEEYEAVEVIVGLPQTLRGERGKAAGLASAFAQRVRRRIDPIPVRMADERLTTVTASRALRESGVSAKGQRPMIDQAAAVAILQGWLDERSRAVNVTDSDGSGRPTEDGL
ncbi:Holliday junction resolvase RuvX [Rhodococcus sp. W8901]|nr:Holliday junction resolvase RuvX [Rhodococcus sp. W8901]